MPETSIDLNERTMANTSLSLQHLLPMQQLLVTLQRFAQTYCANCYILDANGTVLQPNIEFTGDSSIIPNDSIVRFHAPFLIEFQTALTWFLTGRQHQSMQTIMLTCHDDIAMLCTPIMIDHQVCGAICIGPFGQMTKRMQTQPCDEPYHYAVTVENLADYPVLSAEKEQVLIGQLQSIAELLAEIGRSVAFDDQIPYHLQNRREPEDVAGLRDGRGIIQEAAEHLQIVAELNRQVVYDYDLCTGQVHWGGPVQDLTGYPLETLNDEGFIGWAKHIHADDQAVTIARLDTADQQRKPFTLAYRFSAADGSLLFLHEHGISLYGGGDEAVRMIGVISTISKQEVAMGMENGLETSSASLECTKNCVQQSAQEKQPVEGDFLFCSLFDASTEAILLVDFQGMVLKANRAFFQQSGYAMEDIFNQPFQDLVVQSDQQRFASMVAIHRLGKSHSETLPVSYLRKDGTVLPVILSSWMVVDQANSSQCLGVFLRNIGPEMTWAENKAVLGKQVIRSQQNIAIGSLARGVGHDFNSILGGIMGNAELALYRNAAVLDPKMHDYLKRILDCSNRAKKLVQQMVRFGQVSTRTLESIKLTPVLSESIRLLRLNLPPSIRIIPQLTASNDRMLGNTGQLHQMVMNLAVNACHAMRDSGGLLTIALANITVEAPRQWMNTSIAPGRYLRLQVNDTGTGMPPTVLEQIFEPYFTTKNINEGSGLGMSVVLDIVKAHQGWIDIESTMGKGTDCTIFLPLAADNGVEQAPVDHLPLGQGQRVLIVDDEHFYAEVIGESLKMLGYEVTVHRSSLDALRTFKANPDDFDVLVTDQAMPEMTGVQLAREIRMLNQNLPIILCTGYSEIFTEQAIASYGITSLLMKPVHIQELATAVYTALASVAMVSKE